MVGRRWACETALALSADHPRFRAKYPVFMNRYAIPFEWFLREFSVVGRPLRVLEVGPGAGMMLRYAQTALRILGIGYRQAVGAWKAMDIAPDRKALDPLGYDSIMEQDAEALPPGYEDSFDLCLLLHVAEHFDNPESALSRLFALGSPSAMFVAGYPAHFHWLRKIREKKLRSRTNANGHVSALSDRRVKRIARDCGLSCLQSRANFFLRTSGSFLENLVVWHRFNLFWGRLFPFWYAEHTLVFER